MNLNFKALEPIIFSILQSNQVPYINGHAGVGKSAMAECMKKRFEGTGKTCTLVRLVGSVLKEGELGGLPIPHKDSNTGMMLSEYTVYSKLQEIIKHGDDKNHISILFIDELNRAEHAVQQELMDLILTRSINTTHLPNNCVIMTAGNPRGDENMDYQVNEMNAALINRFFYFTLDSNYQDWIEWAMNKNSEENIKGKDKINSNIIDFIVTFPEMLHNIDGNEMIKPTPRGWEMFSRTLYRLKNNFTEQSEYNAAVFSIGSAIVGPTAAHAFKNFLLEKTNPLISVEEIFKSTDEEFKEKVIDRIPNETIPRLFITTERTINFLNTNIEIIFKKKNKQSLKIAERFIEYLKAIPKDSMASAFKRINNNFSELHDKLCSYSDEYLNVFFEVYEKMQIITK